MKKATTTGSGAQARDPYELSEPESRTVLTASQDSQKKDIENFSGHDKELVTREDRHEAPRGQAHQTSLAKLENKISGSSQKPSRNSSDTKATSKPSKKAKELSKMVQELASFNEEPVVENKFEGLDMYLAGSHTTRRLVQKADRLASNTPEVPDSTKPEKKERKPKTIPRKIVILKIPKQSVAHTIKVEAKQDDGNVEHVHVIETETPLRRSLPKQKPMSLNMTWQRRKAEGNKAWSAWKSRKDEIFRLLMKQNDAERKEQNTVFPNLNEVSQDLNMSMEAGICVFSPTAPTIWKFQEFLLNVEKVVGKDVGFAKVIIPNELKSQWCLNQLPFSADLSTFARVDGFIRPSKTKLDLHERLSHGSSVYSITMLGAIQVLLSEWEKSIHSCRNEVLQAHAVGEILVSDLYRQVSSTITEETMIAQSLTAHDERYYTGEVQDFSRIVRDFLHIEGPSLNSLPGNRLQKPSFQSLEMQRPVFQFAGGKGSPFGLQMTNCAAYSLNYLHGGAPKHWTIIKPADQKKVEKFLHEHAEFAAKRLEKRANGNFMSPSHPPRCDQFLSHQQLYVPRETWDEQGISYTEVTQYKGELIICFPFAYHQGFSSGPNLAETVPFADDRWEMIYDSGLLQTCHPGCSGTKVGDAVDPELSDFEVKQEAPLRDDNSNAVDWNSDDYGDGLDASGSLPILWKGDVDDVDYDDSGSNNSIFTSDNESPIRKPAAKRKRVI